MPNFSCSLKQIDHASLIDYVETCALVNNPSLEDWFSRLKKSSIKRNIEFENFSKDIWINHFNERPLVYEESRSSYISLVANKIFNDTYSQYSIQMDSYIKENCSQISFTLKNSLYFSICMVIIYKITLMIKNVIIKIGSQRVGNTFVLSKRTIIINLSVLTVVTTICMLGTLISIHNSKNYPYYSKKHPSLARFFALRGLKEMAEDKEFIKNHSNDVYLSDALSILIKQIKTFTRNYYQKMRYQKAQSVWNEIIKNHT